MFEKDFPAERFALYFVAFLLFLMLSGFALRKSGEDHPAPWAGFVVVIIIGIFGLVAMAVGGKVLIVSAAIATFVFAILYGGLLSLGEKINTEDLALLETANAFHALTAMFVIIQSK